MSISPRSLDSVARINDMIGWVFNMSLGKFVLLLSGDNMPFVFPNNESVIGATKKDKADTHAVLTIVDNNPITRNNILDHVSKHKDGSET